jgi:uncharacterized protein YhfF
MRRCDFETFSPGGYTQPPPASRISFFDARKRRTGHGQTAVKSFGQADGSAGRTERPGTVLETVELTLRWFDEMDAAFVHDEGERMQESRRIAHRTHLSACQLFQAMPLW